VVLQWLRRALIGAYIAARSSSELPQFRQAHLLPASRRSRKVGANCVGHVGHPRVGCVEAAPHRDALRRRLARIVREASEVGVALIYFSLSYRALVSVFMG
jgi:hypothetical protein